MVVRRGQSTYTVMSHLIGNSLQTARMLIKEPQNSGDVPKCKQTFEQGLQQVVDTPSDYPEDPDYSRNDIAKALDSSKKTDWANPSELESLAKTIYKSYQKAEDIKLIRPVEEAIDKQVEIVYGGSVSYPEADSSTGLPKSNYILIEVNQKNRTIQVELQTTRSERIIPFDDILRIKPN